MDVFTVSFFGHRVLEDPLLVERRLERLITDLLREKAYVEFLVGQDGEFDQLAASVVRRCKRSFRDDNSALIWVLPYLTAGLRDNEEAFRAYYDEIEVCAASAAGHFRGAHQARNREMVDRSHLVVCCIQHERGGAWQTVKYARRVGIPIVNVNDPLEER